MNAYLFAFSCVDAYKLLKNKEYHYLNQSGCYKLDGVDDGEDFVRLKVSKTTNRSEPSLPCFVFFFLLQTALRVSGVTPEKIEKLLKVLSAVLQLGNVTFSQKNDIAAVDKASGEFIPRCFHMCMFQNNIWRFCLHPKSFHSCYYHCRTSRGESR